MSKLDELIAARETYKNLLRNQSQEIVLEWAKGIFDANPTVTAIRWRQYTPAWNDGDPCRFTMEEFYFQFSDRQFDDDECEHGDGFGWVEDMGYTELPSDVAEAAFGTNKMITITKDGIEIEGYWRH